MLTPQDFYNATAMLLVRLGNAIDIDELDVPSLDPKAQKRRRWYDRLATAMDIFADIDLPDLPVCIPLKKFSQDGLDRLRRDWPELTRDLPLAGLRYWHGKPVVFGAKVVHEEDPSDIEDLIERMHAEFHSFACTHEAFFSESGYNVCDLCFAFTDRTAFQETKARIRKTKGGFWKGTYTFGWFLDLETLELAMTRGLTPVHLGIVDKTALALRRNHRAQSLEAWRAPNRFVTGGLLGPVLFQQFLGLYLKLKRGG
jgi:hypothetical protein